MGVAVGIPVGYYAAASYVDRVSSTLSNVYVLQAIDLTLASGYHAEYWRDPAKIHEIIPDLNLDGILGAGYCPDDGFFDATKISNTLARWAREGGVQILAGTEVLDINTKDGKVTGVRMQDGHRIECDCVISSAGVDNTFNHLVPEGVAESCGYLECMAKVEPSVGHLGVYVGLKGTASELGLPRTNFWIYPSNDYDAALDAFLADPDAPFPIVYLSFPSAKDPDYENRHPGTATIEIVAPAPYEWFAKWRDETWGKRGEDYESLKSKFGDRLMDTLYQKLPQVRGKVDYYEVSTPLSTNWFGGYQRGELYGLAHTQQRLKQDWLGPKSRIPGLWLTGQDTLTCGVTGAMMSGLITTMSMVGAKTMAPLLKRIYA